MNPVATISLVDTPEQLAQIRELFLEYARSLEFHICFDDFERELAGLPAPYAPPGGRLFLASAGGRVAGCVAVKKTAETIYELKRLYVRPEFRRQRIGQQLVSSALDLVRGAGGQRVELDTLPQMRAAQAIYQRAGFRRKTGSALDRIEMEIEFRGE